MTIRTRDLTKHFGDVTAVQDLNLEVHAGEVFGFLGHNGAGKTTTVRLLNGVLSASSGEARVLGLDPFTEGPSLRQQTGVLTETPSLDVRLTARETLAVYGRLYGVEGDQLQARVSDLLNRFELADRAGDLVGGFSRGMRQRLALARALLHDPSVIFLDEPTAGLDPVGRRAVHEMILDLSRHDERTVLLCTHDLAEAQKLCDRVGVMERGHLAAVGTPTGLAQELHHGIRLAIELDSHPSAAVLAAAKAQIPADGSGPTWHAESHTLHVWLPVRDAIPDLVQKLVTAGSCIYGVTKEEPTLEDVYFALHEVGNARGYAGGDR